MQILRVFNNNVVLARRAEGEVIVTGRGIGFQAKAGMEVDPAKVAKVFVPDTGRDPDHSAEMLAAIPGEFIHLVLEALLKVGVPEELHGKLTLVVALADHIHGATQRSTQVDYPLEAEVRHLYPTDFATAKALLGEINRELAHPLPDSEAVALTLHMVNAHFSVGDLSGTYRMTGLIQQLLDIIGEFYGVKLPAEDISVARFITHLRYLFVRLADNAQLTSEHSSVGEAISQQYPEAARCAETVAGVVNLRMAAELTADEVSYLTLHIARLGDAAR